MKTAARRASRRLIALIGQPLPNERVEGVWGNREVPPHEAKEGGNMGETWFPPWEQAEGERRSRPDELLHRDVHRLDLHVAHPRESVGDSLLHRSRHLRQDATVRHDELELGAGTSVLELDAQPPASLAQPGAVDRRDRPAHDLAQRSLADAHRPARLLD